MNKLFIFTLFLLIVAYYSKAQIKNGVVYYTIFYKNDTLSKEQSAFLDSHEGQLVFKGNEALFKYTSELSKQKMENCIYTNTDKNQICVRSHIPFCSKLYTYEPDIPKIHWQLRPESKMIHQYNCQKAVAKFRGRVWEVWFTTQIPVRFGPWKLHGLPGLILEACTQDSTINIHYKGAEIPAPEQMIQQYSPPPYQKDVKTSWEEYKEHYKTRIDKRIEEITAQMNAEEERLPPEDRVKLSFKYTSSVPKWELEFE